MTILNCNPKVSDSTLHHLSALHSIRIYAGSVITVMYSWVFIALLRGRMGLNEHILVFSGFSLNCCMFRIVPKLTAFGFFPRGCSEITDDKHDANVAECK